MSQGLFNALFLGPKEDAGARKVIKFAAYFGFVTTTLALAILFIPFEPIQSAIGERISSKWSVVGAGLIAFVCFYFLLKEKIWAPSLLLLLEVLDFISTYMETGDFFKSFSGIPILIYGSALNAMFYLSKNNKESDTSSEAEAN